MQEQLPSCREKSDIKNVKVIIALLDFSLRSKG